ncbi:MAG TPA: RidA family protein [Casimicrobiaceae bacterium]|nr:RidA family protein [Casimicrobiaceae bacterium]
MINKTLNPATVHQPAGLYSHGVIAKASGEWLYVAGQVGIEPDGALAQGFAEQARATWTNVVAVLAAAGMDVQHLVKVTTFLTDADNLPQLNPVRAKILGDARPASTLVIVKALAKPEWLIEVEAVARKD